MADTKIYDNLEAPDPMATLRGMADTATAVANARRAKTQLEGDTALGQAVQEASGPDGQVDTNRLVQILKTNPKAAMAAAAGTDLALAQKGVQIENQTKNVGLMQGAFGNLGAAWAARLAQTKGPVAVEDLLNDAADLAIQGRIPPQLWKSLMRTAPGRGQDARKWASGGYIQGLPSTMTAGLVAAPPDASGAPRQQTGAQMLDQTLGGASDATPVAPGGPARGGPAPMTTGLAPGDTESGVANANMGVGLQSLSNEVPNRVALLDNMRLHARDFTGGPLSEEIKNGIAGINQVFGTKINLEGVAGQEMFDKIANQIALSQSSALGITDLTTRTSMGANPHAGLSTLGIEGVIDMLKGNEDAIAVKGKAYQNFLNGGGKPAQFSKWSSTFNQNFDPRVFQSVYMTDDQRKKMVASLTETDRDKFREKYNFAVKNKWIPDPRPPTMSRPEFNSRFEGK